MKIKRVVEGKITLGPAGPPLHKGVFVVLQSEQHFLFSLIIPAHNDSWIITNDGYHKLIVQK